jgi:hypothetical protein
MSTALAPRGRRILAAVLVMRWEDASALQYLVPRSDRSPHWVAIVPAQAERPAWIPRSAQPHSLQLDETAYTWRDGDA